MKSEINYIIDLGAIGEKEVTVQYDYSPGRPGRMYMPNGDPGYPDEPAECYVLKVFMDGHDVTWLLEDHLNEDETFAEAVMENHQDGGDYE